MYCVHTGIVICAQTHICTHALTNFSSQVSRQKYLSQVQQNPKRILEYQHAYFFFQISVTAARTQVLGKTFFLPDFCHYCNHSG